MLQQAERWTDMANNLTEYRQKLASELTENLAAIEAESGIFLIKPMLSYKKT